VEGSGKPGLLGRRTNVILGLIALLILTGSLGALVYNASTTGSTDVLTVCGKEYDWKDLENRFETRESNGHSGILVSDLVVDSGFKDPEGKSIRFIGADGYQKEIPWASAGNGLIDVGEKKVVFPDLYKSFWVRDLVEIEVVE